jgi:autotransporter translocation and assembly factor TamB
VFDTVKKTAKAFWRGLKTALYYVLHLSKWTFIFIFLGVVSAAVIFWALYSRGYFHELVELAIEKYLGNYTKTEVRVDRVEGPLFTGVDIYGFGIGNGPSIEEDGCAVTVDEIHVKYNPIPFFFKNFTVDEVYLVHPQCMLRRDDDTGRLNLARIFSPKKKKEGRGSYFTIKHVEMDDAFFIMFLNSPIYRFEDAHIETKFTKARGAVFLELGDCSVYLPHFNQWIPSFGNGDIAVNARRIRMDNLNVETPTTKIVTNGIIKMPEEGRTRLDLSFKADPLDLGEVSQAVFDEPIPVFGTGAYTGRLYGPTNDLNQEGTLTLPKGYLYDFDWTGLSAEYTFRISDRYLSVSEVSGDMDGMPVTFQIDMFFPRGGAPEYFGAAILDDADLGKYVRSGFLDSDVDVYVDFTGKGLSSDYHDLHCVAELRPGRIGPLDIDGGRADFRYSMGKTELYDVSLEMGDGDVKIVGEADADTVDIAVNAVDVPLNHVKLGKKASEASGTFSFDGEISGDNRYPSFEGGLLLKNFDYSPIHFELARFDGDWKEYGRADEGELHAMFWDGKLAGIPLSAGRVDIVVDNDRLTARRGRINIDEANYIDFRLDYILDEKLLAVDKLDFSYTGGKASLNAPLYLDMSGGKYTLTGGELVSGDGYVSLKGTYVPAGGAYEFEARAGAIPLGDVIPRTEKLDVDGYLTELVVSGDGTTDDPRFESHVRADNLAINGEYIEYVDGKVLFYDHSFFVDNLTASTYNGNVSINGAMPVAALRGEGGETVDVRIVFNRFDARLINAAAGMEVVDSGSINGTVVLTGTAGDTAINGELTFKDLVHDDAKFENGRLEFAYADGLLKLEEVSLSETDSPNLTVHGTVPVDLKTLEENGNPFNGEIDLEIALKDLGLSLANLFTDEVLVTDGAASGNVTIEGAFEKPRVQGEFVVSDGAGFVRTLRNNLTALEGKIIWDDAGIKLGSDEEPVACTVDEGPATVYGRVYMNGLTPESFDIHADLKDYLVKALGGIHAKGDISVDVSGPVSKPFVTADVDVHSALIAMPFGGESGGETYGAGEEAVDFTAAIKADRGVWLRNNSADIEFSVDMIVRRENGKMLYMGELEAVRGEYYFLQRDFKIEHANINFTGAEELDPRLDILGSIIIRGEESDATVYIEIKGTMREPELVLRSPEYPGLMQDQLMLMLALNITWDDYQEMGGGAGALASKETREYFEKYAFNEVSRLLQRETQIDVFKIETTGLTGTEAETGVETTVGKYVTSDLYLSYTGKYSESGEYGTKEYTQAVGVEYRLHPGIYVFGETEREEEEQKYGIGLKFIHKY